MPIRRKSLLHVIVAAIVAFALLFALLLIVLLLQRRTAAVPEADPAADAAAQAAPTDVPAQDPWAGKEDVAVAAVQALPVGDTSVGARMEAQWLQGVWPALAHATEGEGVWRATRVDTSSVYEVRWVLPVRGVDDGPRWLVELDPRAQAARAGRAVVPSNALAGFVEREDYTEVQALVNRSTEALDLLQLHRFGSGYRLAGVLLVHLRQRGTLAPDRILGWFVLPDALEPGQSLRYDALFRWLEDERVQVARWEVDLHTNQFRPRNLLANQILTRAATFPLDRVRPLELPRSGPQRTPLDLSTPPDRERQPLLRALRWVASDEALREGVAFLLAIEGTQEGTQHRGWRVDPAEGSTTLFHVSYVVERSEVEERIVWEVDATTGARRGLTPIAEVADKVLRFQGSRGAP